MTADHGADRDGPGFGVVLRTHRRRAGLTQQELAARAGVGVRTVRDLERGRASRPQRTTVDLLAAALGLTGADRAAFAAAARGQPPAAAARAVPLPPAGDLIGRDADVAELVARLSTPSGPGGVTLVGLAGVGKTSLALSVAHRVRAAYPGGVAGLVVTDVSTAADVLSIAAAVFGVARVDDLAARLAAGPALIVVDAVERAPEAVAEGLSVLLRRVPALRFVATGRHPLGLPQERVWPVAPLVVPPVDAGPELADVARYAAAALFLDRLARVRRAPVAPAEVPALVTLVRRLAGLPLAVELAAARGRELSVAAILDRYGDRVLDLSDGAGADATARSLRDAVAASYRLLDPAEQAAVRLLAAFRNRWSTALAGQLLGRRPAGGADLVRLLDRLLELGLLTVRGTGAVRFRLLDVVRDFALERAAAAGELTAVRRRHAAVIADLAWRVAPDLVGGTLPDAARRLDDVNGDLGAALGFAAAEDPHAALRLAAALPRWWRFRGRDGTGRRWLRRLLDDPRTADADPRIRAWAQVGLAQLAGEHGAGEPERDAARDAARAALAAFERWDVPAGRFAAHTVLAVLETARGRYGAAREHGETARALARTAGRVRDMAVAENNLTWHEVRRGRLAAARHRLEEVDRLARRCGEDRLRAVALANLAEVARLDGALDEAAHLGRRAAAELAAVGDPGQRRRALATAGLALADAGRTGEAAAVLAELRTGGLPDDGPAAVVAGAVAARRGERTRAAAAFAAAAGAYGGGYDPRDVVTALLGVVANAPEEQERRAAAWRVTALCAEAGITLVPRERQVLEAGAGAGPGAGAAG